MQVIERSTLATPIEHENEGQETTTFNVRGIAGLMFWAGLPVAGFVPPVGAAMMVIGGVVWLLAPTNAPAAQSMVDKKSTRGTGCGCTAAAGATVIMLVAGALALAAAMMLMEVGP